jgi:hypothetical protein
MKPFQSIDYSALRTNQAVIISLLVLGFILNTQWLVTLVALIMLAGSILRRPGFGWVYTRVLRPLKMTRPDILQDNREPHVFAQSFGGVVLVIASLLFLTGWSNVGWGLSWLVVGLAALNLFAGFCVGCAVYYWLMRLNVPGFTQSPPPGNFPGLRPRKEEQ